jgi:hypothetical protein
MSEAKEPVDNTPIEAIGDAITSVIDQIMDQNPEVTATHVVISLFAKSVEIISLMPELELRQFLLRGQIHTLTQELAREEGETH